MNRHQKKSSEEKRLRVLKCSLKPSQKRKKKTKGNLFISHKRLPNGSIYIPNNNQNQKLFGENELNKHMLYHTRINEKNITTTVTTAMTTIPFVCAVFSFFFMDEYFGFFFFLMEKRYYKPIKMGFSSLFFFAHFDFLKKFIRRRRFCCSSFSFLPEEKMTWVLRLKSNFIWNTMGSNVLHQHSFPAKRLFQ